MEFALLAFLHRHPGRLFTAQELLKEVWQDPGYSLPDLVRVTVYTLRRHAGPDVVDSVRLYGYGVCVPLPLD
jgi:DNA-binding response OmpR family regulator